MSFLKIAIASVLALSLVLGLALPALAAQDKPLPWTEDFQASIVKGEVTEVDEENQAYFKVQSGEDEIGIRVDENTRYFMLDVAGRIVPLLQQFRLRNQAEFGTPEEQGLRLRLHNQAEVNAQGEPGLRLRLQNQAEVNAQDEQCMGLGLKNRVRAGALVQNQARLRVQNQVAQTETVSIELQPARLRVQNQVAQPESVPLAEPQQAGWQWCRPFGAGAEFSDIEVGDRVVVWMANGDNLAAKVVVYLPD